MGDAGSNVLCVHGQARDGDAQASCAFEEGLKDSFDGTRFLTMDISWLLSVGSPFSEQ